MHTKGDIQIFGINKENNESYSFMSVIAHKSKTVGE